MTLVIRFMSHVDTTAGEQMCWPWTGALNENGYGVMHNELGSRRATHVALGLAGKEQPSKKHHALHQCDNPPCVNPAHLFWGTQKVNGEDMASKRRSPAGEKNGQSKLTKEQVAGIRRYRAAGVRYADICATYGVSKSTVSRIVNRASWTDA